MKLLWVWIVLPFAFAQLVTAFFDFNETELSLIESLEYGASKINYNPLMVGLTLIHTAGAKGAGTFPTIYFFIFYSRFRLFFLPKKKGFVEITLII